MSLRRLLLTAFLVLLTTGCVCMPTRISDAPMDPDEQQRLQATMAEVGTWRVSGFEDRRGNHDPDPGGELLYVFRDDGTGTYDQTMLGTRRTNDFLWELDGRNLLLHMDRGGRTSTFRVDAFDDTSMRWFNYLDSGYFLMEPHKE